MLGWLFGPKAPRCIVCSKRMRLIRTIDAHDRMHELRMYQCPRCGCTSTIEMPRKLETHPDW